MKYTGACPKCQSHDLVRVPGGAGGYEGGNHIQIGRTIFGVVPVTRHVCMNCGFVEEWVDAPEDLDRLRRKFGDRKG